LIIPGGEVIIQLVGTELLMEPIKFQPLFNSMLSHSKRVPDIKKVSGSENLNQYPTPVLSVSADT
jgi:hypothetical protein